MTLMDPQRHLATVDLRNAKGLFDYLVGECELRRWHVETQRPSDFAVFRLMTYSNLMARIARH